MKIIIKTNYYYLLMSNFIHENENQLKDNNKYLLNVNDEINNECVVIHAKSLT